LWQRCCRIAQVRVSKFFLFEQFQIELPLNENAIILARKADISPVGVRPGAKNELPP
jgi:hypothetical protein